MRCFVSEYFSVNSELNTAVYHFTSLNDGITWMTFAVSVKSLRLCADGHGSYKTVKSVGSRNKTK